MKQPQDLETFDVTILSDEFGNVGIKFGVTDGHRKGKSPRFWLTPALAASLSAELVRVAQQQAKVEASTTRQ